MYRTFNCGIGMVLCVDENDVGKAMAVLQSCGEQVSVIGAIESARDCPITID